MISSLVRKYPERAIYYTSRSGRRNKTILIPLGAVRGMESDLCPSPSLKTEMTIIPTLHLHRRLVQLATLFIAFSRLLIQGLKVVQVDQTY